MTPASKYRREVKSDAPAVAVPVDTDDLIDARVWLKERAEAYTLIWLLAHADDGVIWGKWCKDSQILLTSGDAASGDNEAREVCPPLRLDTLQQARLFAPHAELLLWRDGDNAWRANLIQDATSSVPQKAYEWTEYFDEPQMLWGTHSRHLHEHFTMLWEGAHGLRHAVPCKLPLAKDNKATPPLLIVRHYLPPDGYARVVASRLCGLEPCD
ncbi:MAG: CRISPR-associated protein Csx19 [Nitrococcus sp.]|nr:CRISPR-associated protein Csx19 [Nitrococcus sp.]